MRWHSPPDWTDAEPSDEFKDTFDGGGSSSARGQLSNRMRKEGILQYCISVNIVSCGQRIKYIYGRTLPFYKFMEMIIDILNS